MLNAQHTRHIYRLKTLPICDSYAACDTAWTVYCVHIYKKNVVKIKQKRRRGIIKTQMKHENEIAGYIYIMVTSDIHAQMALYYLVIFFYQQ